MSLLLCRNLTSQPVGPVRLIVPRTQRHPYCPNAWQVSLGQNRLGMHFFKTTFNIQCKSQASLWEYRLHDRGKPSKPGAQWLWLSWYSGRFRYQRSAVRIQSLAKFIEHLFTVNCIEKTKIKKQRPGMAHFF